MKKFLYPYKYLEHDNEEKIVTGTITAKSWEQAAKMVSDAKEDWHYKPGSVEFLSLTLIA